MFFLRQQSNILFKFKFKFSSNEIIRQLYAGHCSKYGSVSFWHANHSSSNSNWHLLKNIKNLIYSYKKLSKAKLSTFVVLSTGTGFILGSDENINYNKLFWTMFGTFGASACANTLNQIYEIKNDSIMSRTRNRPLPQGLITSKHALTFSLFMAFYGLTTLYINTNSMATSLAGFNIILYSGIYTPLKQITTLNTWIGAIVGAIPPLIGWSAASGGDLAPRSWLLASCLYFWQIPHFLALAYLHKEDYIAAGYKMLSKMDPNGRLTARCAFRNIIYMSPLGFLAYLSDVTSGYFALESFLLTFMFALNASVFRQMPNKYLARQTFKASLVFLPVFMALMILHRIPNDKTLTWDTLPMKLKIWFNSYFIVKHDENFGYDFYFNVSDDENTRKEKNALDMVPFPFVPLPMIKVKESILWDGLDDTIDKCKHKNS